MAEPTYNYIPIPPRHIRLLRLGAGNEEDQLCLEPFAAPLDQIPRFIALSYVWGSAERTHTVFCHKKRLSVPQSCYDVLVGVRRRDESVTVWIDAICINQDSDEEKSSQIPLMSKIYGDAAEVIAWLGTEEEQGVPEVLDLIKQLAELKAGLTNRQGNIAAEDVKRFRDIEAQVLGTWSYKNQFCQRIAEILYYLWYACKQSLS